MHRAVLLVVLVGLCFAWSHHAHAQTSNTGKAPIESARWRLHLDGGISDWPVEVDAGSVDSLRSVVRRLLRHMRSRGYYYASVDSAQVDRDREPPVVHVFARRGPRVRIHELQIEGVTSVLEDVLRSAMGTDEGDILRPGRLEADIDSVLAIYEREGHPLAEIRVDERLMRAGKQSGLHLTLSVDEGPEGRLERIQLPDGTRTSPALVAQLADLELGAPLGSLDLEAVQRRLRSRRLFTSVGPPELTVGPGGGAVMKIPIEEAAPGTFDLALGYLPPSNTRDSGQLVGSGHLRLQNLFGGGRTADFTLDRRPGRTSIVDASVSDPFLFDLPLRTTAHFRGEQRDSTYGERTYDLSLGYRLGSEVEVRANVSREVVRPGAAGTRLADGRQLISRSTTFFYGFGFRYEGIDRLKNPRRGGVADVHYARGAKDRTGRRVDAEGDTSTVSTSTQQERLRVRLRAYVPLFERQVLAVGGEGAILFAPHGGTDRSDLYRLGGATSLRGYDEDQFLGDAVGRALLEYRLQLDPASYAYAFVDVGYVSRPARNRDVAAGEWHPGYGIGVELQTEIGRISASYALNPDVESPANGRIHVGLSVGL